MVSLFKDDKPHFTEPLRSLSRDLMPFGQLFGISIQFGAIVLFMLFLHSSFSFQMRVKNKILSERSLWNMLVKL